MSDERYEIQQTNQNVYQANETEGENFEREYEKGARNSSETGPELGKPKKGKKPYLKENHKRLLKRAAALALSGVLLGGAAGVSFVAVNRIAQDSSEAEKVVSSTPTLQTAADTKDGNIKGQSLDVSDIASATMPSIVSITNKSVQEVQNYFDMFGMGGQMQEQEVESAGSGIIVGQNDTELLIVTNNHVVENADTLSVAFVDNEVYEAAIKGTDADNDLAVVAVKLEEISDDTMSEIKAIQLGDSENLQVGEQVVAIGNALGYGQSVTTGIVSAVDRQLDEASCNLIQTDAAINPGNSGGALLNANGEVIGINTAKVSADSVEGMGYAIPISDASDIITDLMNQETKTKVSEEEQGYIGIRSEADVTSDLADMYNMPTGVYVSEIIDGGAAQKAGIQRGSIITAINGTSVDGMTALQEQLQYYRAGETVTLTVATAGNNGEYENSDVEVTLGKSAQ